MNAQSNRKKNHRYAPDRFFEANRQKLPADLYQALSMLYWLSPGLMAGIETP
jgi:hypothetical protein